MSIQHISQFDLFATELLLLVESTIQAKLENAELNLLELLETASAIFAGFHSVSRNSINWHKDNKAIVSNERILMDKIHLKLQNLKFQQNHLQKSIRNCEAYDSEYSTLTLHSLEELTALGAQEMVPPGLPDLTEANSHELMLQRLNFELLERQRFEEERKVLLQRKNEFVKENELKKIKLLNLESQLDSFVLAAKEIQSKMEINSF